MNKKQSILAYFIGILSIIPLSLLWAEVIPPILGKTQIQAFLNELNKQGIVVSYDPSLKQDEVTGQQEDSAFYLKGEVTEWYYLNKADINNDGMEEYILCSAGGSGGFSDIDAIYKEKDGKWVNIFDEIKLPLRKLIREAENEKYDLEEGWGLINGSLAIEKKDGLVYFTLEQVTRKYESNGFKEDFNPPQGYKFLWENRKLKLVEYYVGDKIYKSTLAEKVGNEQEQVNWDKIEAALYEELKANSGKPEAEIHQAIGYSLLQSDNQWERAAAHFKKAVGLDPSLYFSWYNLGLINADTEEGYNYFKKAIEAKPDFATPYYWMAYYRCRNREDKMAIPLFQKYLEVAKGNKDEAGRIKVAQDVLNDLLSGKEGKDLKMMRRPNGEE